MKPIRLIRSFPLLFGICFGICAAALLVGCQSSLLALKDDPVFQQTIPVCQTEEECHRVWTAAREWVQQATPQGLAVDSAQRLQTNPADDEALDWETDITVDKVPLGDGKYQVVIGIGCNPAINNCDAAREKMRQFNRDMARYASSSRSQEILRVFSDEDDMDALFSSYAAALDEAALRAHAEKYFLPSLIISGERVRRLDTREQVVAFLESTRARVDSDKIARIAAEEKKVLSSGPHTAVVTVLWGFYDAGDDLLFRQKATYNLIKVGKAWKIILAAFDT